MTVPAERLREGQHILVQGTISFSRLAALIEGEALQRSIQQATARGALYPTKVPHTTVSLVDAQVLPADANAITPEEQFVFEKIFAIKSGDNAGKPGFSIDNKSNYLPTVLEMDPDNAGEYRQLVLERDLATGMSVILVLETFKQGDYAKRGLGLQQVILQEPVRYYSSGFDASALSARGIIVNGPVRSVAGTGAAATPAEATEQFNAEAGRNGFPVPANTGTNAQGLPVPMPGAQGIAPQVAPAGYPAAAPVAPAYPAAAVAAPAAPVAQAAPLAQAFPAAPETPEQQIARLQQQVNERSAAAAASGGGSAFDAAPAAAPAQPSPWGVPGQVSGAYQG